ncbi:unnamed protein product [Aphis gossypii]|uniref:Uncharacterized protein n=1 Tax=Aphis gossypii TaxID=80765 RepID=A0A9P0NLY9_APHGO|nr:unnamed protein product [Aphis gossypii]
MGKSTGKDVLIFKRFQLSWNNLNKQNSGIAEKYVKKIIKPERKRLLEFLKNNLNNAQPRNDYKELLELALIFLGEKPKTLTFFHVPGAIHRARWMAKAIYCIKIYLFRNEFKLSAKEKLHFTIYVCF